MTDAELIAELRLIGCHENGDARCTCGIGQDAADLITAQAERIKALEEGLDDLIADMDRLNTSLAAEVTESERLRKALLRIANNHVAFSCAASEVARAAIAQGQKEGE